MGGSHGDSSKRYTGQSRSLLCIVTTEAVGERKVATELTYVVACGSVPRLTILPTGKKPSFNTEANY
jgi:hypothetical protein